MGPLERSQRCGGHYYILQKAVLKVKFVNVNTEKMCKMRINIFSLIMMIEVIEEYINAQTDANATKLQGALPDNAGSEPDELSKVI